MTSLNVQSYAKLAGILGLVSFVGGGFGEAYVPSMLIARQDAAATATNILGAEFLFRLGFAGYLLEAIADVGVTWALYILLRPVDRSLALLAVLFRVIATAGFAMSQVLYFSALPMLKGVPAVQTMPAESREAMALLFINTGSLGTQMFSMFYGAAAILLGYLIFRSTFLPRFLGLLLAVSGVVFPLRLFVLVLAPSYDSPVVLITVGVAWLSLTLWLLVKGVDVEKWHNGPTPLPAER